MNKFILGQAIQAIRLTGAVTQAIRQRYFLGIPVRTIREFMEKNNIDPNTEIELYSTEIAVILTPSNVQESSCLLMQKRPCDDLKLGFWGGVTRDDETAIQGAIREISEELGISISPEQLEIWGTDIHLHIYANGNMAKFFTTRYILNLSEQPISIPESNETAGFYKLYLGDEHLTNVLSHQQQWAEEILYTA